MTRTTGKQRGAVLPVVAVITLLALSSIAQVAHAASTVTTLTTPNPFVIGQFGGSVAISGTTVVVGAPGEKVGIFGGAGNAYLFDATSGTLISALTNPNPQLGGDFGHSVAISDTTVVVGAPGEKVGGNSGHGRVYLFDATTGDPISTLTSPNPLGGSFGASVGVFVDDVTVVVGAPLETAGTPPVPAGNAYVF